MSERDDIQAVHSFLSDFQNDLDFIVDNAEDFLPGYQQRTDSDHYENLRKAWEGTEGESGVKELFNELTGDDEREGDIADLDVDWEGYGLTGNQLHFKLEAVDEMRAGFAAIRKSWDNINHLVDSVRTKVIGPITASYLDTAETVLDSVLGAVGGKEAISELKEMIRNMLPF